MAATDERWVARRAALLLLSAWVALLGWQAADHIAEARRHRESLERAGRASIGMLEAALRSVGRGRRQRPEFLEVVFSEVFSVPGIRGAWLTDAEGAVLFARDDREGASYSPGPAAISAPRWSDDGVLVGRQADIGECPFDGMGRRRSAAAASGPHQLFLFMDRADVDRELTADLQLRAVIQTIALVAGLGAFLVLRARARTRRLSTDLAVTEERSRRHREWALLGAGLAHETKNPLSVIRGVAQRLTSETSGNARGNDAAREIVDEVDRVVARINEFLHYSRPAEPRVEAVALRGLLDEMAKLVEPDLVPSDGQMTVEVGQRKVQADRGMLRQILLNLLVNAARAMRQDGEIRVTARDAADGTVTLEVHDNGSGIPAEEIEKVFEPYYTRAEKGTGLGLAIVRRLVEAHGWKVELESRLGAGTTARILGMERTLHEPGAQTDPGS